MGHAFGGFRFAHAVIGGLYGTFSRRHSVSSSYGAGEILVLPGIAALRLAGSVAGAFAIACAVAAAASLGGFALAWRADLPAGPVEVALAATPWLIAGSVSVARRLARSLT